MLFVITSSLLCKDDFLNRIEKIAESKPDRIILREKHLREEDYFLLAKKCQEICWQYQVNFSVNSFVNTAERLKSDLHISFQTLEENPEIIQKFKITGVSVHSKEEAIQAEKLGAAYLIAGHIFQTDCKKDLQPRGTAFLQEVCRSVQIPVLAIGGITKEKRSEIYSCQAAGVCLMSHFMTCEHITEEVQAFQKFS